MPIREIKVYDRPFKSMEDMLFEDPNNRAPSPSEVWKQQMQEGEIALFCVDGKTGRPRAAEPGRTGVCYVTSDMAEIREYGRKLVKQHPARVCILRNRAGRVVRRIQSPTPLWLGVIFFSALTAFLLAMSSLGALILWPFYCLLTHTRFILPALSALHWFKLLAGGLVVSITALSFIIWILFKRKTRKASSTLLDQFSMLKSMLTPAEEDRFREIDQLMASGRPEDREEARQRWREYQQRIAELQHSALHKKSGRPNSEVSENTQ